MNFEALGEKDKVSWIGMDGGSIRAFYVDFYTDNDAYVMALYVEGKLAKCIGSSCLPVYGWIEFAETLSRVHRFITENNLIDYKE